MSMDEKLQVVKEDIIAMGALAEKLKNDQAALNEEVAREVAATGAQVASDTSVKSAPETKPA
jgi:hypothetical protein